MSKLERFVVLYALAYMAIWVPIFFLWVPQADPDRFFSVILPLHLLGIVQNFVALAVTIRDLYLRPFSRPNQKLTWGLLIVSTGGVGWIIYLFKHAWKSRSQSAPR